MPAISVVIGYYNRISVLRLTIDSVCAELTDIAHEILSIYSKTAYLYEQ